MKKGRTKYYIIINTLLILILSIIVFLVVLKLNNISVKSFVSDLFQQNDSDNIVDNKETEESTEEETKEEETEEETEPETEVVEDVYDTITISAAGDVTLGRDSEYGYTGSFDHELELQDNDYSYFFRNVKDVFEADDITLVNLETTLTSATKKADKSFRFKADPSYVEILKEGSIEAVSIANNHSRDYLEEGYQDTINTLEDADVGYFGYEHKYLEDIRGIKVGLAGFYFMKETEELKENIKTSIEDLRNEGADIVILMCHWGIEKDNYPNSIQRNIAHYSIDKGADLVLGTHPHVLQGVEEYKGKNIVYSLANFSFGGNKNPFDYDTMIYVHKFNFKNGELISEENEVIPCSISSVSNRNNYQPTILEGEEKERVLARIEEYSEPLNIIE